MVSAAAPTLPEFDGDRCLLAATAASQCSVCARICPTEALIVREGDLGFIEESCISCGLCAAACPEAAIAFPQYIVRRLIDGRMAILAACHVAAAQELGQSSGDGVIFCLGGLSLRDLIVLRNAGAQEAICATGDCASCEYGARRNAFDVLSLFADMLSSRGEPSWRVVAMPFSDWRALRDASAPAMGPKLERRAFFDFFKPQTQSAAVDGFGLPIHSDADVVAYAPRIDEALCVGCDACARLCPHGALNFIAVDGKRAYTTAPRACTGCALCVDVCEEKAIEIQAPAQAKSQISALSQFKCQYCGAPFHWPQARADQPSACPICAKVDHRANLFQFLP